jgi:hypothetical protein
VIEIWAYRQKDGPEILLGNRYADTKEAIESLCKFELGYGGQVTELGAERIEVVTTILHCKDRTVYIGSKEAMTDLVVAACLWLRADRKVSFDDWWKSVSAATKGVPLLVAMSAGILRGELVKKKLVEQLQGMA